MAMHKRKTMAISSLSDLVYLVNNNTGSFDSAIRKLTRKNRSAKIIGFMALCVGVYTAIEYQKQEEELYKLSIRLKKLENKEGE